MARADQQVPQFMRDRVTEHLAESQPYDEVGTHARIRRADFRATARPSDADIHAREDIYVASFSARLISRCGAWPMLQTATLIFAAPNAAVT